jgi:hypothetical protein
MPSFDAIIRCPEGFAFGKQHFLNFNPLPQAQGSLRPSFPSRLMVSIPARLWRPALVDFAEDFFRPSHSVNDSAYGCWYPLSSIVLRQLPGG